MTAGTYNITIEQGANYVLQVTYKDTNGDPVDITGYLARMQGRPYKAAADSELLFDIDSDGSEMSITGASGIIDINIPAATTAAITVFKGVYDLEIVSGGGVVTRLLEGTITINHEVTR